MRRFPEPSWQKSGGGGLCDCPIVKFVSNPKATPEIGRWFAITCGYTGVTRAATLTRVKALSIALGAYLEKTASKRSRLAVPNYLRFQASPVQRYATNL